MAGGTKGKGADPEMGIVTQNLADCARNANLVEQPCFWLTDGLKRCQIDWGANHRSGDRHAAWSRGE
jgi:hypothetical protein